MRHNFIQKILAAHNVTVRRDRRTVKPRWAEFDLKGKMRLREPNTRGTWYTTHAHKILLVSIRKMAVFCPSCPLDQTAKSAWWTGENEDFMRKVIFDWCAYFCIFLHTTVYGAMTATTSCLHWGLSRQG